MRDKKLDAELEETGALIRELLESFPGTPERTRKLRREAKLRELDVRKTQRLESKGKRKCQVCRDPIPVTARADAVVCGPACRQRKRRANPSSR